MDGQTKSWSGVEIFTIGHSTRALDELASWLRSLKVSTLADIRTIPRSRHNPQFDGAALRASLGRRGLRYVHLPELGGLRRARAGSPSSAWRNASFRGYADYMLTDAFDGGLSRLLDLASESRVALMCAEAVPWRCHRSLLADALEARGARVQHITGPSRSSRHRVTPFARVQGSRVTYPGDADPDEPLATSGPLHLEATARVLQRLPANPIDLWEEEEYRRAVATRDGLALIRVRNHGGADRPDLRLSIGPGRGSPAVRACAARLVRRVLGLDLEPSPLHSVARAALGPIADGLRGMRPPRFPDLFETFANVVPFQQVSLESGLAIVGRLVERFGQRLDLGGRRFHAFPAADRIAEAPASSLRECGMSSRKAEALRALAGSIASGRLSEAALSAMGTEDALAYLRELPGIGPWSAGLVLLRGLGRLDIFPLGDVGATRGLAGLMRLEPGASLQAAVERAGERRGYLYFCALGGRLLQRGLIHPAGPRGQ